MQNRWKTAVEFLASRVPARLKGIVRSRTPTPDRSVVPLPMEPGSDATATAESDPTLKGEFWAIAEPERRRDGKLTIGVKASARLETVDLVDMRVISEPKIFPNGETHWTQSGRPEDVVADFAPITVHGTLDSGRDVTLVDAMGTAILFDQTFRVGYVLDGAHVDGHDQRFSAVRFQLDDPGWWTNLEDGMTAEAGTVGSLSVLREGGLVWFVFEFTEPVTLRECDSSVVLPARTLANLATMLDFQIGPTQLRVDADGSSWITVLSKNRTPRPVKYGGSRPPEFLLRPAAVLTVERFAQWINVSAGMDGLPVVVANPPTNAAIETKALTMASVAEGLHRRLFDESKRFQTIKPAQRKIARKAAVAIGVMAFEKAGYSDLEEVRDVLTKALGHITEMPYRSRLEDLQQEAVSVVPEVTASFQEPTWAQLVVKTRNLLAHQLDGDKRTMLQKIDDMTLVAWSLPWVLRIVLLLRAGVEPTVIRNGLVNFSPFQYYQANIAAIQSKSQH
ncbi:HEPN domain-containing protein [Rhodococcus jostii]|uniref:ApeA N-terminal domain-containing protein n=1 Tax=Rhodococcus jostii TaxID=132919 RepID=A0ABU4C9S5_RHOJO|nr:HEPN domain-containing protein [Rhodococcus jostii]MDV6280173.1 hypothetical protein [Rhodococcus jostii]